jgi:hypothetical protein
MQAWEELRCDACSYAIPGLPVAFFLISSTESSMSPFILPSTDVIIAVLRQNDRLQLEAVADQPADATQQKQQRSDGK